MFMIISLLFSLSFANENTFTYNNWNYGECELTKVDEVLFCKTEKQSCIVDMNSLGHDGKRYIKIACENLNGQ